MAVFEGISELDIRGGNFEEYRRNLDYYFLQNDVNPKIKVPIFITVIGREAYDVLRTLIHPINPLTKSYEELVEVLQVCGVLPHILNILPQSSADIDPEPIRISTNFWIHPKFRSGGISVNFVFRSGQKLC